MIRRPMVFLSVLFLLATFALLQIRPVRGEPPDVPPGSSLIISGEISDKQYKSDSYILTLKNAAPENGDSGRQKALVYLKDEYDSPVDLPPMGSLVRVKGDFSLFKEATNPGQFDMREYYHIRGIEYRLFNAGILSYGKRHDVIKEALYKIRIRMAAVYEEQLPEKENGVIKAMILGDRSALDPDIRDLYQSNGIAHALSISGLHISILGYGLYRLLKKLRAGPLLSSIFCFVFISLYSVMVGGSTSTVRAVIMFGTCLAADLLHRSYDILSALSLSLISILFTDPLYIYESGFMLSFGAVMGIGIISPFLRKGIPFGESKFLSGILASTSINLFTLPVVLYFFYEIPVYSILLNLAVIPCMGVLVISALFLGLMGMVLPVLAFPAGLICRLILTFYEKGCLLCSCVPGSVLITGRPEIRKIVIYYILLFLLLLFLRRKERKNRLRKKRKSTAGYIIILMLLPAVLILHSRNGLNYTMLDIGQGDCNVIQGDDGRTVIIDCGSSSEKEIARYKLIPFLKSCGAGSVDAVVLTHSDMDHISGIKELLSMERTGGIRIKNLILPSGTEDDRKFTELRSEAEKAGIRVSFINTGQSVDTGKLHFFCLSPDKGFYASDANEYSVVLKLEYGDFTALFTGDTQGGAERQMVERLKAGSRISVLKVAHHGSRYSTPEEMLMKTKPLYSLISSGKKNRYGHPHPELIERLESVSSEIHETKNEGAISVKTNGKKISVSGFLKNP